jgi:hypothetical protein
MTDKELFKKAEKIFNLNENIVEKCYKNGQFNKILNENIGSSARTSKQVGDPDFKKSGGLLGGLARGVGNVVKAPFKLAKGIGDIAAAGGKGYRNAQTEKARMQREREKTKQERLKTKKLKQELRRKPQKPATSDYVNPSALSKPAPTSKPTPPAKPAPVSNVKFKVGDEVFVKTKKNPKAVGTVSAIIDKPGFIQIKVNGGAAYAFDKRNVSLKRGVNKESYKRQS